MNKWINIRIKRDKYLKAMQVHFFNYYSVLMGDNTSTIATDPGIAKYIANVTVYKNILTGQVTVRLLTTRPGLVIGRKGVNLNEIRETINTMCDVKKTVVMDVVDCNLKFWKDKIDEHKFNRLPCG